MSSSDDSSDDDAATTLDQAAVDELREAGNASFTAKDTAEAGPVLVQGRGDAQGRWKTGRQLPRTSPPTQLEHGACCCGAPRRGIRGRGPELVEGPPGTVGRRLQKKNLFETSSSLAMGERPERAIASPRARRAAPRKTSTRVDTCRRPRDRQLCTCEACNGCALLSPTLVQHLRERGRRSRPIRRAPCSLRRLAIQSAAHLGLPGGLRQ